VNKRPTPLVLPLTGVFLGAVVFVALTMHPLAFVAAGLAGTGAAIAIAVNTGRMLRR
jgi:p-aminobenzoyl-glutamate transporter AbgT